MVPLTKAVAAAYEYTIFDTVATMLLMRRDSRMMIQMLLEHGADPRQRDNSDMNAQEMADLPPMNIHDPLYGVQPDWLIQQLLKSTPHPDLYRFLTITDAV